MLTTLSTEAATSWCAKSDCGVDRRDLEPHLNCFILNEHSKTPERTRRLGRSGKEMRVNQARYPADHVKRLVLSLFVQWDDLLASQRSTIILRECASPRFIISLAHHLHQGVALLETLERQATCQAVGNSEVCKVSAPENRDWLASTCLPGSAPSASTFCTANG